jgi:hypothetical protein
MKKKQQKHTIRKILTTSLTFVAMLGVSAAATYFLIPNKVTQAQVNNGGNNANPGDDGMSDTDQFMVRLEDAAANGLSATINASFNAPVKTLKTAATENAAAVYETHDNLIGISGGTLQLVMPSLDELGLTLYAPISYNGKTRQLDLTIKDKVAYFAVSNPGASAENAWDLKYKLDWNPFTFVDSEGVSHETSKGDLDVLVEDVLTALGGPDALSVPSTFTDGSIDTSTLMDDFGAMKSVTQNDGSINYYFTLHLGSVTLPIAMSSDKNYSLTSCTLPGYQDATGQSDVITFSNGMTTKLGLAVNTKAVSIAVPSNADNYHKLVNSLGLFDTIYPLVKSPVFDVNLTSSLSHVVSDAVKDAGGVVTTPEVDETAALTLSANANLSNLKQPQINASLALSADSKTQAIAMDYVSSADNTALAYLNYQNVVKAKMSKLTLDELMGRLTKISNPTTSDAKTLDQIESVKNMASKVKLLNTIFAIEHGVSSIKNSDLVSGATAGHYESVLDVIKSIVSSDDKIVVTLTLVPAGVQGTIVVTLDAKASSLLSVEFQNVALASFTFNGTLAVATAYTARTVNDADYQELTHAPTIYDQVKDIVDAKQAAFTVAGSILDASSIGFDFSGSAELDVLSSSATYKSGSGAIVINDHKAKYNQTYNVAIDVVKTENMFFTYNSGSKTNTLQGRFTIDTLNDMIALGKDLMNTKDERFTRYFDKLSDSVSSTILGDVIDNKLNALISNDLIVSSSFTSGKSVVVLSKNLMGTDSDITLTIAYDAKGKLASFNVLMGKGGKTINVTAGLATYDGNLQRIASHDTSKFIDFSDLAVLMKYGIKTSELNTYHMSISGSAKVGVLKLTAITADFYVYVNGATVKMYGYVHLPVVIGVNGLLTGNRDTYLYYDNNGTADGVDTVYMKRVDDLWGWSWDKTYYKRVQGSEFRSNMLNWIMGFVVGLSDSNMTSLSSSTVGSSPIYVEDVIKSFTYSAGANNNPNWVVSLDMGALAGTSALKDLNATISGDHDILNAINGTLVIQEIIEIDVTFDAKLTNVAAGVESECWESSGTSTKWASYIASHSSDAFSTSYKA